MTTGIYLSAMTQDSGKSLIALGLADSLVKRADRVGFFRPIFKGETASDDPMIRLMKEHFNLSDEQVGGNFFIGGNRAGRNFFGVALRNEL